MTDEQTPKPPAPRPPASRPPASRPPARPAGSSFVRDLAAPTRDAIRLAIAEAREALKDRAEFRVEFRVERLSREESRRRTRELLLDAAAEVFNRLGYHGASLEAVAEAAGFTKGAVYSNFATKGELFTALLERYTRQRLAAQDEVLEHASLQQLADYAGELIRQQAAEQSTWDLLQIEFWLAAMRDPRMRELLVEGTDELYRQSGERLEAKLAEAGARSAFTGTELSRLMNALGSGLLLQVYLEPDAVDPALFGRAIRVLAGLPDSGDATRARPGDEPEAG
ncbi:MAG: helix-turn-helix domain-containing protein [Chloroflexota bacterium]